LYVPIPVISMSSSHSPSMADTQTQMMLMLMESCTKLSIALLDKAGMSMMDWPKFSGDD